MNRANIILLNYLLIVLLCFYSKPTIAQNNKIDSLWSEWKNDINSDTLKLKALADFIKQKYRVLNPDSALYYAKIGYDFAKKKQLKKELAAFLSIKGNAYKLKTDYIKALKFFFEAVELNEKIGDKYAKANYLSEIANIYLIQDNYSEALAYYFSVLKMNEELGIDSNQSIPLGGIGSVFFGLGNYDKAFEYSSKALSVAEKYNNKREIYVNLCNIGNVFAQKSNYTKTIEYHLKALDILKKLGDKRNEIILLTNIGTSQRELNNNTEALKYYKLALSLAEELNDIRGKTLTLEHLGWFYKSISDYKNAEKHFLLLENISEQSKLDLRLQNACYGLTEVYKSTNRIQLAFSYYQKYILLKDKIQGEDDYKATVQQEMQYEYDKQAAIDSIANAKEIEIKEAEIAQQKAEVKAQRNQQYALYGGVGLLLIFGGVMYNRYRITNNQKNIIAEQKKEVDIQKIEAETQRDIAQKEHTEAEKQKLLVEEKNQEIMDSIQYAKRLQDAILPPQRIVKEYLEQSFILFQPKEIVSGDFYWMEVKDELTMFAVADCTGHGVPGAMVSVVCANALNKSVNELNCKNPADILNKTRELVVETFVKTGNKEQIKDGMDISLCVLNEVTGVLQWSGANNPLWIYREKNKEIEVIKPDNQSVGFDDRLLPFSFHEIKLQNKDAIYLFSDGYADQFGGEKGKKFKSVQFKNLIMQIAEKTMDDQKQELLDVFEKWKGNLEQIDDVSIIGVRFEKENECPFTRRELEIIVELSKGLSSKEIAEKLHLSSNTVDTHRRRIISKTELKSTAQVVNYCKQNNWI